MTLSLTLALALTQPLTLTLTLTLALALAGQGPGGGGGGGILTTVASFGGVLSYQLGLFDVYKVGVRARGGQGVDWGWGSR